jgi:hypothetical protein
MKKEVIIDFDATTGVPVKAEMEIDIPDLPALPEADGEYKLVITGGVPTWVSLT